MTTFTPATTTWGGGARVIALLGALVALGPLTIDMYLPALPAVAADLHTQEALVQLTLTGTLLGLGLGQLLVGPLSDAIGRRHPLLVGVALHILASVLSTVTADIATLGVLRVFQGVGAAAATVVSMAVVRDLFEGRRAATAVSRLMLVMGVAPILAPSLGSLVLLAGSWRWVFGALALLGAALIVLAAVALPETLPPERRLAAGARQSVGAYRSVLGDGRFVLLTAATALTFAAAFSFVSGSSFVLQGQYGLDQQQFGLAFGACALVMILGSQLNPPLLTRFAPERIAGVAVTVMVLSGLVLIGLQTTGLGGMPGFLAPVMVMLAAGWLAIPNTTAAALSRHGQAAGTAAAVVGACQFTVGALVAPMVGVLGNDGLATASAMTTSAALAAFALIGVATRRPAAASQPESASA
jgi:DHA1 family bicyclomycin/chloramphenicol resistance-like MFS transporter